MLRGGGGWIDRAWSKFGQQMGSNIGKWKISSVYLLKHGDGDAVVSALDFRSEGQDTLPHIFSLHPGV